MPFLRFGFVLLSAGLVAACSGGDAASGGAAPGKAGGGGGGPGGGRGGPPPVVVDEVREAEFADRVETVGTAFANEQADLSSPVTERIARLNFRDGQYVPRGAVIAELVRTQQGASLAESRARLIEAERRLDRLRQLQAQGFATRAQLDEAEAAVNVARAQGASAAGQIGDRVIRAPFSGWLALRRISPGAVVNQGTTIATIVDYSRIKLDFPVPETFLATVRPGLEIEATAAAFPGEVFRGRVETIEPLVDPVTRAITVRAILPNPDLRLKPGMLMTVTLQTAPRTTLVVPELAIVGEGTRSFVFAVDEEDVARRQEVRIGTRREGRVEIVSGVEAGQRVIIEGTVRARDGGPVRPQPPGTIAAPPPGDGRAGGGRA